MSLRMSDDVEGHVFEIVEAIAEAEGVDVVDLPPLGETLDTDALETLVSAERDVTITFEYAGYRVGVDSRGTVTIE